MTSIKLRSRWAVEECIATLQEQSMSKFVHYNSSRSFTKGKLKKTTTYQKLGFFIS